MEENRRWDWYEGKDEQTKTFLHGLLGRFCYGSWMEAMGFAMTQLLRHGKLTPWDSQYDMIERLDGLGWESDFSLSVDMVIVQPCFRKMRVTKSDLINYVTEMQTSPNLDPDQRRFILTNHERDVRVKAVQGQSGNVLAAIERLNGDARIGRPFRPGDGDFQTILMHGASSADAQLIYRDGLLTGGTSGY